MRIAQQFTSCDSYAAHKASGKAASQHALILAHIERHGGDWSIGELARALGLEKSTISARIWELLNTDTLAATAPRKDRVSGIRVRPVGLPVVGQQELFSMAAQAAQPGMGNPVLPFMPSPIHGQD